MAELAKKLHFKKDNTEHTAKAYTVAEEAGTEYITNKIDGVVCYIAIGATNDERATMGRVIKNGTKAILNSGKPPYAEKAYTSPGTHTFTVPKNVRKIRYAICGAGSGAMGRGQYKANVSAGGNSSLNNITATGGSGGRIYIVDLGRWIGGNSQARYDQQQGGSPNGRKGAVANNSDYNKGAEVQGGTGWALNFNSQNGNYGKGGNGRTWNWGSCIGGGYLVAGASGGYKTGYLDVTPNQTLSVNVGGSSSGYWRGDGGNANVDWGANGFVLIAWGGYI